MLSFAASVDGDADQGEARAGALLKPPEQAVTMARIPGRDLSAEMPKPCAVKEFYYKSHVVRYSCEHTVVAKGLSIHKAVLCNGLSEMCEANHI